MDAAGGELRNGRGTPPPLGATFTPRTLARACCARRRLAGAAHPPGLSRRASCRHPSASFPRPAPRGVGRASHARQGRASPGRSAASRRRRHRLRPRARKWPFRLSERLTDTTLQMVRNVPHLALIPLVILWFGIEEEAKLFLVALGRVLPGLRQHAARDPLRRPAARRDGSYLRHVAADPVSARDPPGRAALDLRRRPLRARHHVADPDRRGNDLGPVRPRLHGDAGARIHARRRRRARDPDLRAARQAADTATRFSNARFLPGTPPTATFEGNCSRHAGTTSHPFSGRPLLRRWLRLSRSAPARQISASERPVAARKGPARSWGRPFDQARQGR